MSHEQNRQNPSQSQPNRQSDSDTEGGEIEIVSSDFVLSGSVTAPRDEKIPWAVTEIENTASAAHGWVRTEVRFYDSSDTLLESREGYSGYIPANTVWKDYIRYYTETLDRLDRVDARIVDNDPVVDGGEIKDATIVSSEMTADPEGGVDLTAEIDLKGTDADRVTVVGLFYDDQGQFRGTVRDVDTNPMETVALSAGSVSIRTPPDLQDQQVVSHDTVLLDGTI